MPTAPTATDTMEPTTRRPGTAHSGGVHLPAGLHPRSGAESRASGGSRRRVKGWTSSIISPRRGSHRQHPDYTSSRDTAASSNSPRAPKWWKIRLFRGMARDVRRRAPYYWTDWRDAWNYRVVPATVYMYFANLLPALAFSLDMFTRTNMNYGVNEVLLASVLGSVVFSFFACQPLVIVGVTGPITVFNYTVFDIMNPTGTYYLGFMCWIGLWALVLHWILAITNSCNWLRYVTRFPCDIFGFYVACIYLQKGVQVLNNLGDQQPFYLSIMVGLLVFMVAYICGELGRSRLFTHQVRIFLKDYGTPLTVIFFSGFVHIGKMRGVHLENLPTGIAFEPTQQQRGWLVDFWNMSVSDVFLALPFAVLLTILFWFDHNVSSLIAQGTEFPLAKPAGFHWDLFLLGLTTGVAGLLGLPFPNGLIPQAPFHTEALRVTEVISDDEGGRSKGHLTTRTTHVVEQRVSNLAQGLLTLGTMTGPLLTVLHLIPQGVLAGLFFIMGFQALEGNGITVKLLFLLTDRSSVAPSSPLARLPRRRAAWLFVGVEILAFAATFAITETVAAVGFPVIILALIPVRAAVLPRWFTPLELSVLDAPTAGPFAMESVGGSYGGDDGGGEGEWGAADESGGGGRGRSDAGDAAGDGGVIEGAGGSDEATETERDDKVGDIPVRGGGLFGARVGEEHELAELGESRTGMTRRRLSGHARDDGA